MKTSINGIDLIKKWEGCRLQAYLCPAGLVTIGYGNTFYEDGKRIKISDKITKERAEQLLLNLLPKYEAIVNNKIVNKVINQNQYDALVSFCWNTGGSKDLFMFINNNAPIPFVAQWLRTHYIMGGGRRLQGLVNRRNEEANLYEKSI
jgi:lysozyme